MVYTTPDVINDCVELTDPSDDMHRIYTNVWSGAVRQIHTALRTGKGVQIPCFGKITRFRASQKPVFVMSDQFMSTHSIMIRKTPPALHVPCTNLNFALLGMDVGIEKQLAKAIIDTIFGRIGQFISNGSEPVKIVIGKVGEFAGKNRRAAFRFSPEMLGHDKAVTRHITLPLEGGRKSFANYAPGTHQPSSQKFASRTVSGDSMYAPNAKLFRPQKGMGMSSSIPRASRMGESSRQSSPSISSHTPRKCSRQPFASTAWTNRSEPPQVRTIAKSRPATPNQHQSQELDRTYAKFATKATNSAPAFRNTPDDELLSASALQVPQGLSSTLTATASPIKSTPRPAFALTKMPGWGGR
jgi:hypothetical protein